MTIIVKWVIIHAIHYKQYLANCPFGDKKIDWLDYEIQF